MRGDRYEKEIGGLGQEARGVPVGQFRGETEGRPLLIEPLRIHDVREKSQPPALLLWLWLQLSFC